MSSFRSRFFAVAAVLSTAWAVSAQTTTLNPKINSPYSRFGLGDFNNLYFPVQAGQGGLSAAYHDPFHANVLNPASLSQLKATAFDVGLNARFGELATDDAKQSLWSGNLTHLSLAFPLVNPINKVLDRREAPFGLGMAFTLQPYSTVGYNVETTQQVDGAGQSTNFLIGAGETYRLSWGNGVKYGPVSAGVTLGYNWGTITNTRLVEFDSLDLAYTTQFEDQLTINGLFWRFGAQYTYEFKKINSKGEEEPSGKRLILGVHGSSGNDFNTDASRFGERYNLNFGAPFVIDTLFNESGVAGTGRLPAEFAVGLSYQEVNKWRLGVELGMQQWSNYENEGQSAQNLADTWEVRAGAEFIPDYLSYNSYLARVRYRVGMFYGQDPRQFSGDQLLDYGLTLGLGFPIILPRQRTSFVNFAVEAGRFGVAEGLRETYINMTLGFTLNDNTWFFKRKFN